MPAHPIRNTLYRIGVQHDFHGEQMYREQLAALMEEPLPLFLDDHRMEQFNNHAYALLKIHHNVINREASLQRMTPIEVRFLRVTAFAYVEKVAAELKAEPLPQTLSEFLRQEAEDLLKQLESAKQ